MTILLLQFNYSNMYMFIETLLNKFNVTMKLKFK